MESIHQTADPQSHQCTHLPGEEWDDECCQKRAQRLAQLEQERNREPLVESGRAIEQHLSEGHSG